MIDIYIYTHKYIIIIWIIYLTSSTMSDTVQRVKPPIKDADPQWTIVWSALSWFVWSNVVTDSDSYQIHRIVAHVPLISSFLSPNQFLFRVGYLSMSGWWFPKYLACHDLNFEFWFMIYASFWSVAPVKTQREIQTWPFLGSGNRLSEAMFGVCRWFLTAIPKFHWSNRIFVGWLPSFISEFPLFLA